MPRHAIILLVSCSRPCLAACCVGSARCTLHTAYDYLEVMLAFPAARLSLSSCLILTGGMYTYIWCPSVVRAGFKAHQCGINPAGHRLTLDRFPLPALAVRAGPEAASRRATRRLPLRTELSQLRVP